jgi:3-polyprenyl-4-hydroxybenzoate decarboxylase
VTATRHIVVALSGASGAIHGIRSLEALRADPPVEIHAIVSKGARWTGPHR